MSDSNSGAADDQPPSSTLQAAARAAAPVELDPTDAPVPNDFAAEAEALVTKTSDLARELDELDIEITAAEAAAASLASSNRAASSRP